MKTSVTNEIAAIESLVIATLLRFRSFDLIMTDKAPIISSSDEDFFTLVVNSSFRMEFSAKITAVAVLILNLDCVKESSQVIKTISESGLSSSLFIITFNLFVVVKFNHGMFSK